jgi:hypothetical protein
MYYIQLLAQQLVSFFASGILPFDMQTMGNGWTPQPEAFIAARLTTIGFGAATTIAVMLLVRELGGGLITIILAGLLVAMNPLAVDHSRLISPDIPATFFVTLAVFYSARIAQAGGLNSYLAAGVMAGLAASTKYNAGLVAVSIVVAHVLHHGPATSRAGLLAASAAVSIAAFLLSSPYMLLDFGNATEDFLFEVRHYRTGHAGAEGDTLQTNLSWLVEFVGPILPLALVPALGRDRRSFVAIYAFILAYFLLISVQVVRFERNLLPIVPTLCALISIGMTRFVRRGVEWLECPKMLTITLIVCSALLCAPTLSRTLGDTRDRLHDQRAHVRQWLQQEIPAGSSILVESYGPYVDPKELKLTGIKAFALRLPLAKLVSQDVVVISRGGSGRFLSQPMSDEAQTFEQIKARACRMEELRDADGAIDTWVFFFRSAPRCA